MASLSVVVERTLNPFLLEVMMSEAEGSLDATKRGRDRKSSRFITGATLLGGVALLGTGIGLAAGQPGYGLIIGLGAGIVTIAAIRAARGF